MMPSPLFNSKFKVKGCCLCLVHYSYILHMGYCLHYVFGGVLFLLNFCSSTMMLQFWGLPLPPPTPRTSVQCALLPKEPTCLPKLRPPWWVGVWPLRLALDLPSSKRSLSRFGTTPSARTYTDPWPPEASQSTCFALDKRDRTPAWETAADQWSVSRADHISRLELSHGESVSSFCGLYLVTTNRKQIKPSCPIQMRVFSSKWELPFGSLLPS